MKRFYKTAEAVNLLGHWTVVLDNKPIVTPLRNKFILSTEKLAQEIAKEWEAQTDELMSDTMPLTKLANTLIDKMSNKTLRFAMEAEVVKYAETDLVCYYAEKPEELASLQKEKWLPLTDWVHNNFGVSFKSVEGVVYIDQEDGSISKVKKIIQDMSGVAFTAMQNLTSVTGSFVISLALIKGKITVDEAYQAAFVDDLYQIKKWGSDDEAERRLSSLKEDIKITKYFYDIS